MPHIGRGTNEKLSKGVLIVAALLLIVVLGGSYMDGRFILHSPSWPDPASGRVILKTFDHGNFQRYVSRTEELSYDVFTFGGIITALIILAVTIVRRRRLVRDKKDA